MKKRHMSKNTKTVLILLVIAALIAIVPLFARKGASFGGSDDAGSVMVEEVRGEEYEPWFTPVLEDLLDGELPGEVESLLFCIQTGIGMGIIAFFMGRLVERKKWMNKYKEEEQDKKENTDYAGD
nr:cobalt transport protein CbiN [Lachnoclostridium phocaeense]